MPGFGDAISRGVRYTVPNPLKEVHRKARGKFPSLWAMVSALWDGHGMRTEGRSCFAALLMGTTADFFPAEQRKGERSEKNKSY